MTDKLVAVIDWKDAPLSEPSASVEREIIGGVAEVRSYLCNSDADFIDEILDADAIILWHNCPVKADGIRKLRHCRAIIRNGVGFDTVDLDAAAQRGIAVCNVPDYGTEEVADHAIGLTLALCRQLFRLNAQATALDWTIPGDAAMRMRRLRELTLGIVGLGRIGTATALRARALGFQVAFHDPYLPNGVDKAVGVRRVRTLDGLLGIADVLSLHCPLKEETRHLIGPGELSRMKPTAFLVNTARGAVVDKAALLAALREGRLAGAGLDVIEGEPLRNAEEAATPNLIITPHAAFYSIESMQEMRRTSASIARAAVLGEPLENVVNEVADTGPDRGGSCTRGN
jgi:phosphoglycerate dehydrogenase-like enzyme